VKRNQSVPGEQAVVVMHGRAGQGWVVLTGVRVALRAAIIISDWLMHSLMPSQNFLYCKIKARQLTE